MDIRIINSKGDIINASRLSITTNSRWLIGLTEESKQVLIEDCRNEEEAVAYLDAVKGAIKVGQEEQLGSVLIDLEGKEYIPLEEKKCKCEGGCKCNGESEHD